MRKLAVLGLIILFVGIAQAGTLCLTTGLCLTDSIPVVSDADTLTIDGIRYRLWGVDGPEKNQPYGFESQMCLRDTVRQVDVLALERRGTSYDRVVVQMFAVEGPHAITLRDIALDLLKRGCVWHATEFSGGMQTYADAEQSARAAKRGLWSLPDPVAPWIWRKRWQSEKTKKEEGNYGT